MTQSEVPRLTPEERAPLTTPERIRRIAESAEAWRAVDAHVADCTWCSTEIRENQDACGIWVRLRASAFAIESNSRSDLPRLLSDLEAAEARIKEMEAGNAALQQIITSLQDELDHSVETL